MNVTQLCRLPGGEAALRQLALQKAQANPDAIGGVGPEDYVDMMTKQDLCAFLKDNDLDWFCQQPGYRPQLEALAQQKLQENPNLLPAGQSVSETSTQELCAVLKGIENVRGAIPVLSIIEQTAVLIPMIAAVNGNYCDFVDVIQLHQLGAPVQRTTDGVIVQGNHYIRMLDRTLTTDVQRLALTWLIDTRTPQGQQLAKEWGSQLYHQDAWRDALPILDEVKDTEMYAWSVDHRPDNLDQTAQAMQLERQRGNYQNDTQEQVWPTPILDDRGVPIPGEYMLPVSVETARGTLRAFADSNGDRERAGYTLKMLNAFLSEAQALDSNYNAEDRFTQNVVIVYMWSQNSAHSRPDTTYTTLEQVKTALQSRGLDELLAEFFMTAGRLDTWKTYVTNNLNNFVPMAPHLLSDASSEDQMTAVEVDNRDIRHIERPSVDVQMAAIQTDPFGIRYIRHPAPEVQMAAVQTMPFAISNIDDPTPEVQWAAVQGNPFVIEKIGNPTPELQMAAVQQNPFAIEKIHNQTPELQMAAVQQNPFAIEKIRDQTPGLQMAAVERNPFVIERIRNPTHALQMAAVERNAFAIERIRNPTPEVQMAAVQRNPFAIQRIRDPTPEVQMAAVQRNPYALHSMHDDNDHPMVM